MENEMMIKPADRPAETTDSMLTRLASEINAIKEQTRKTVYLAMMDIGQRLLQAKGAVGHGNWEKWLKDNVDYSPRTAQRLIASYERFGDGQQKLFGRSADPEQLAELNKTQIMTLMSIKDEEKCFEFMDEHKGEIKDMSKTELEDIAKELNETVAELNRTKHKLTDAKNMADTFQKRLADNENAMDDYKKQLADNENAMADYKKQLAGLQSQLDEAGESRELADLKAKYTALQRDLARADRKHEQIAEEAGRYQSLFEESQQKVDALSKELEEAKSQPIEAATVEKIVEVEKVPEETQKQLELMQARIRELEAVSKDTKTPEEKAFGHHLMNVKSEMEAAITQLMAISDGEKRIRYAMLLRKLLKGTLSMTSWAEG
ncbi:MAG: DUF3102 domain-containing protein [Anaerovibrio sp.]|uniref:DUF3102 domain-containing protein n=1 Tax=Anaerovibrio sp. TaxID=1872532 RepID=UPI00262B04C9|nr:DUF3102 domain-containing protein [Anaerovibrio sp.]MDD7676915.1 DUF3102 domain-containing protein [Anaerovibrio sp.]MDY2603179.1 DUF3102 domain-containing protein [Anaerovibrio sp.]